MSFKPWLFSKCTFEPMYFTRDEVRELCPWLIQLDEDSLGYQHHIPYQSALARICLVSEGHVAPLLDYALNTTRPVVVISLPPSFEPFLGEVACFSPGFYCKESLTLTGATSFAEWSSQEGTWPFHFSVHTEMYTELLSCHDPLVPGQRIIYPARRQSVIVISGDRVAVGGFWLTEDEVGMLQGCDMSVASWHRNHDYTPEEIEEAIASCKATGISWSGLNYLHKGTDGQPGFTMTEYLDIRHHPLPEYFDEF